MTSQQDGEIPDWDLADRMRKSLRHAGMTPGQMAAYLGVGGNTVSTWINGRIQPSFQTVRLWSIRTNTDLEWLLGGTLVPAGRGVNITSLSPAPGCGVRTRAEGRLAA